MQTPSSNEDQFCTDCKAADSAIREDTFHVPPHVPVIQLTIAITILPSLSLEYSRQLPSHHLNSKVPAD